MDQGSEIKLLLLLLLLLMMRKRRNLAFLGQVKPLLLLINWRMKFVQSNHWTKISTLGPVRGRLDVQNTWTTMKPVKGLR